MLKVVSILFALIDIILVAIGSVQIILRVNWLPGGIDAIARPFTFYLIILIILSGILIIILKTNDIFQKILSWAVIIISISFLGYFLYLLNNSIIVI